MENQEDQLQEKDSQINEVPVVDTPMEEKVEQEPEQVVEVEQEVVAEVEPIEVAEQQEVSKVTSLNTSPIDDKVKKNILGGILFGVVAAVCFVLITVISNQVFHNVSGSSNGTSEVVQNPMNIVSGGAVGAETDVSKIAENVMPAVVAITQTSKQKSTTAFGTSETPVTGSGTGFIVSQTTKELLIVTNNHVVQGSEKISVQFVDGKKATAQIKGTDSTADLAVLSIDVSAMDKATVSKIKVAVLGDSSQLKVGQKAVAIGNALGYGQSVTVGYISALNRSVTITDETTGKQHSMTLIQTDAAINPGNSGGALLDSNGKVIGINSVKYADSLVEGMGYAIPISKAVPIINELMKREILKDSEKGYLGITGKTVSDSEHETYDIPLGVVIKEVAKGGAAEAGGLKAGDIIIKINDLEVKAVEEVVEKVNSYRIGTEITVTVMRKTNGNYAQKDVKCKLKDSSTISNLDVGNNSSTNNDSDSNSGNQGNDDNNSNNDSNSDEGSSGQTVPRGGSLY